MENNVRESNTSNHSLTSSPSLRKSGRLAKEGIVPVKFQSAHIGLKFRPKPSILQSDQDRMQLTPERRLSSLAGRNLDAVDSKRLFLARSRWISLGEGWFQCTPVGSGKSSHAGLHSVIESSAGQIYLCVYEPRSIEASQACVSSAPRYDLEVSAKVIKDVTTARKQQFQINFAFKSPTDCLSVILDCIAQKWQLLRITENNESVITEVSDLEVKPNVFYTLLLQIRCATVSVDVNGIPLFTSVKIPDMVELGGLVGVQANGTKFAIKGWKMRAPRERDGKCVGSRDAGACMYLFINELTFRIVLLSITHFNHFFGKSILLWLLLFLRGYS